ncbi:hypothetical protein OIV83_004236 [Microbotryomycetes sp. JL201]|nr:hypothetical protein OIV83_004236 [Microbotryomycetes sp. JL201]
MNPAAPLYFTSALGIAKLDQESDYLRRSRKVRPYLEWIECWGVIDVSQAKPAARATTDETTNRDKKDKSTQRAIGSIVQGHQEDVLEQLETAKEMWDALERRNRKSGASGSY